MTEDAPTEVAGETISKLVLYLGTFGAIASIIGLFVTIWTLLRVQSIARAREQEREEFARALSLPEMQDNLSTALMLMQSSTDPSAEIAKGQIASMRAGIDAAVRILMPEKNEAELLSGVDIVRENYWSEGFASRAIGRARKELTIVTWRNTRCFNEARLQAYVTLVSSNPEIRIRIFYASPSAPDAVYETMEKMLTIGNANEMREQQVNQTKFALNTLVNYAKAKNLTQNQLDQIELYQFDVVPHLHCILVDEEVNWGINFYMDPAIGATEQLSTAFLRSSTKNAFGIKILEQVRVLEGLSERVELLLPPDPGQKEVVS